jgi:tetratricopeptide (TPR) repeat protein
MLLGQLKDAEQSASDSLQIAERLGDVYNQGFARLALGQIYTARCVYASLAESILERAIKDLESVGAKFDLGNAWVALGNFYFTQDEYDFAQRSFKRAHELLSTLDFKYGLGWLYFYQGILADRLQSPKRAEDFFEKSEEIARSIGSRYLQSQVLLRRALITLYDTKEIRGQYFLGESLVLAEEMRYHDVIAKVNLHKGISMLGNSYNSDDVFIYFWEAVRSAICYNCFLLDEVASTIRKRDCPQFIREAIIHKWKETDLLSVELDNRDKEVGQRYSNLDKILG